MIDLTRIIKIIGLERLERVVVYLFNAENRKSVGFCFHKFDNIGIELTFGLAIVSINAKLMIHLYILF